MIFRFKFTNPNTGKVIRTRLAYDRKNPGNLYFTGQGFGISMNPEQSIELANRIADLLEDPAKP